MSKFGWLLIAIALSMSACRNMTVPIDTACAWVKPITTTAAERKVMTRETKLEIAAHNELYDLKCGILK